MNIGFYVDSLEGTPETIELYKSLNKLVENKTVDDVSLFYNKVNFNPEQPKFGVFNSTETWCFTGTLIVTRIENVKKVQSVVNKAKVVYLYDKRDRNVFDLISLSGDIPVIAKTKEDAEYIYRVSGKPVRSVAASVEEILEVI
jgi:hypothetical protein